MQTAYVLAVEQGGIATGGGGQWYGPPPGGAQPSHRGDSRRGDRQAGLRKERACGFFMK